MAKIPPRKKIELPVIYNEIPKGAVRIIREEYVRVQKGRCYYCKGKLNKKPYMLIIRKPISKNLYPSHFFKYPIHLHHCHKTGLTLGAVHCHCNAVLWEYEGE